MAEIDPPSDTPEFRLPATARGEHVIALFRALLQRAIDDLSSDAPLSERTHGARKRLKRLRGLLRVVRDISPGFYASENVRYRDIGRLVAPMREAGALFEAVDAVELDYSAQLSADPFHNLRADLSRKADNQISPAFAQMQVDTAIANLHLGLAALWELEWPEQADEEAHGLAVAARRLVRSARASLKTLRHNPDSEALHELRKAVKYLWVGGKFLRNVWLQETRPAGRQLRELIDTLGAIHDIDAILAEIDNRKPGTAQEREAFLALAGARRTRLVGAAMDQLEIIQFPKPGVVAEAVEATAKAEPDAPVAAEAAE